MTKIQIERNQVRDASRRRVTVSAWRKTSLIFALALVMGVTASSASAAYVHNQVTGEYGKEGPKASGVGSGCRVAYQSVNHRLYLFSNSKIYGLDRTAPGNATPLPGFPIAGPNSECGDPDMEVDNSTGGSSNNLYALDYGSGIFGWHPDGSTLSGFPPAGGVSNNTCGVAVTNTGEVWGGQYSTERVVKYASSGAPNGSLALGYRPCKLAIDQTNNDLYVEHFGEDLITKYTAASGYTPTMTFTTDPGYDLGFVVNGAVHHLYVANRSPTVKAYDTSTGALVETINTGETALDVTVDDATDTLFVSTPSAILELPGVVVPDVTTGEPTGNTTASGLVETAGGGNVTECYFQFGTSTAYGLGETSCSPATPYTGTKTVSANLPGLLAEHTYHYRLVAGNANGKNFGADETITPHNVHGLVTLPPAAVTRTSAELKASYEGTNEATHWYFDYGLTEEPYEHQSAPPPGPTEVPTNALTPLHFDVTGLEPGTIYHYRVVAENGDGESKARDVQFITPPAVTGLSTDAATNILTDSADLNGSFTGDGFNTKYFFEWGASTQYGNSTPVGEVEEPNGVITIPAAGISGLQPLHSYHYRVVAENIFGRTDGPDRTFTTFSAPVVLAQSSSEVTATTATLHAVINPKGAETEYHFEYGTTTGYGESAPVPDGVISAGEVGEPVEVHLTGLNGRGYHFRVVATSSRGTTRSNDQTFNFYPPVCPNSAVRQQTGSNTLPDCRAYELVTPEDQGITIIYPATVPFGAHATSPSRLAFGGSFGSVEGVGQPANWEGDTYVATRTSKGWKTRYVGIPSSEASLIGGPPWTYKWFGPAGNQEGADKWLTDVLADPSLSELVDWNDGYYKCVPGNCGGFGNGEGIGSSNAPYVWNSTTGKQVDRWPTNVGSIPDGEFFKGRTAASANLSHFVFTSNIPFAVGGEPGDMYDNDTVHDTVQIANLKENHEHIAGAVPVALSEDGSHIVMTVGGGRLPGSYYMATSGAGELYVRVNDAVTYEIAPGHAVNYLAMTPDGKKIYFTSTEDLTEDNSDKDTSTDLYMWSETSSAPNHLTLISKGNEPTSGNTDACSVSWTVKCGIVPISFTSTTTGGYTRAVAGAGGSPYSDNFLASKNGDIYFLSPEQLHGNNGVSGQQNLYDYRNGKLQFVAALNPDAKACTNNQGELSCADTAVARMEVTPDDAYMAFLTGSKVTGYENAGHPEMYLYRPATDEMTCVSCPPSGAPPTSDVTTSHNGLFLTEDGRVFFETTESLVPQDTNEAIDVYEYVDGRPQLITSGTAAVNNAFGVGSIGTHPGLVGVSADGTDVYFATYDVLVGQDHNGEALKIYDARSGGGFQFNPPVPPCVAADECHGPGSSAPGSAPSGTSSDLGNTGSIQSDQGKLRHGKPRHKRKHHRKAHRKGHGNG